MIDERVQSVDTAIQYIESHLKEPITVADIAAATGYSLFHFIRIFNQVSQHTPYDYLMRRRLSMAAMALLRRDERVIDIALEFQFNNHETFIRAFKRIFNLTPSAWREQGWQDHRLVMPTFDSIYLNALQDPDFQHPNLVSIEEDIILAGLMVQEGTDPDGIPALWSKLKDTMGCINHQLDVIDYWGVRIYPQIRSETSFYLAAIRYPTTKSLPGVFITKPIPAGHYLSALPGNLNGEIALRYLYHTYTPKMGLILGDPLEIEHLTGHREILVPVQRSIRPTK